MMENPEKPIAPGVTVQETPYTTIQESNEGPDPKSPPVGPDETQEENPTRIPPEVPEMPDEEDSSKIPVTPQPAPHIEEVPADPHEHGTSSPGMSSETSE